MYKILIGMCVLFSSYVFADQQKDLGLSLVQTCADETIELENAGMFGELTIENMVGRSAGTKINAYYQECIIKLVRQNQDLLSNETSYRDVVIGGGLLCWIKSSMYQQYVMFKEYGIEQEQLSELAMKEMSDLGVEVQQLAMYLMEQAYQSDISAEQAREACLFACLNDIEQKLM